jgi:hypothetical protein
MAAALLLAGAVVSLEFVSEFGHIAAHFRHRADKLQARVTQMEERLQRQKLELAAMQQRADSADQFKRILSAADAEIIRLESSEPNRSPNATLVLSRQLGAAALDIASLPPVPGRVYQLWWVRRRGAPLLAMTFERSLANGSGTVISLAAPRQEIEAAEITLDQSSSPEKPSGPPILKGEIKRSKT